MTGAELKDELPDCIDLVFRDQDGNELLFQGIERVNEEDIVISLVKDEEDAPSEGCAHTEKKLIPEGGPYYVCLECGQHFNAKRY